MRWLTAPAVQRQPSRQWRALWSTALYGEDLSHGQRFGSVTIVNPFQTKGE